MKPPLPNMSLGRMLDRSDLAALPKPEPLIENWVDLRTANLVVGATGTNKTFALLGWACSVATGVPWLGHRVAVDPATVIYVVGEGGSGLHSRISAWEEDNGIDVPRERLVILLLPDSISSAMFWEELCDLALVVGARLVVLDTFSSLAPAADETDDAAVVLRYMAALATDIDGAVVLAHHTG
jgi:RecA-family ATPase